MPLPGEAVGVLVANWATLMSETQCKEKSVMYKIIRETNTNGDVVERKVAGGLQAAMRFWQGICKEYDFYISHRTGQAIAARIDDFGRACTLVYVGQ